MRPRSETDYWKARAKETEERNAILHRDLNALKISKGDEADVDNLTHHIPSAGCAKSNSLPKCEVGGQMY